ncbi:hypothetical protein OAS39_00600 [Pirellulales bacterium]|nr:hypothetical protein [Pirellulales bacterium]
MSTKSDLHNWISAIGELERRGAPITLEARIAELQQVCADAAAMEAISQRQASERRPWPETTSAFLRDKAKAIYGE